jgi:hypothetical protein
MIEAEAGVPLPAIPPVVPDRVDGAFGVDLAQGVDSALIAQPLVCSTTLRLDQGVVVIRCRRVDVSRLGCHVVVTGQHHRQTACPESCRVRPQPLEPSELVGELGSRLRIAVGRVERGDQRVVDRGLDIAALLVGRIARQCCPGEDQLSTTRQDRDAVPCRLAATRDAIVEDGALQRIATGAVPIRETLSQRPRPIGRAPGCT